MSYLREMAQKHIQEIELESSGQSSSSPGWDTHRQYTPSSIAPNSAANPEYSSPSAGFSGMSEEEMRYMAKVEARRRVMGSAYRDNGSKGAQQNSPSTHAPQYNTQTTARGALPSLQEQEEMWRREYGEMKRQRLNALSRPNDSAQVGQPQDYNQMRFQPQPQQQAHVRSPMQEHQQELIQGQTPRGYESLLRDIGTGPTSNDPNPYNGYQARDVNQSYESIRTAASSGPPAPIPSLSPTDFPSRKPSHMQPSSFSPRGASHHNQVITSPQQLDALPSSGTNYHEHLDVNRNKRASHDIQTKRPVVLIDEQKKAEKEAKRAKELKYREELQQQIENKERRKREERERDRLEAQQLGLNQPTSQTLRGSQVSPQNTVLHQAIGPQLDLNTGTALGQEGNTFIEIAKPIPEGQSYDQSTSNYPQQQSYSNYQIGMANNDPYYFSRLNPVAFGASGLGSQTPRSHDVLTTVAAAAAAAAAAAQHYQNASMGYGYHYPPFANPAFQLQVPNMYGHPHIPFNPHHNVSHPNQADLNQGYANFVVNKPIVNNTDYGNEEQSVPAFVSPDNVSAVSERSASQVSSSNNHKSSLPDQALTKGRGSSVAALNRQRNMGSSIFGGPAEKQSISLKVDVDQNVSEQAVSKFEPFVRKSWIESSRSPPRQYDIPVSRTPTGRITDGSAFMNESDTERQNKIKEQQKRDAEQNRQIALQKKVEERERRRRDEEEDEQRIKREMEEIRRRDKEEDERSKEMLKRKQSKQSISEGKLVNISEINDKEASFSLEGNKKFADKQSNPTSGSSKDSLERNFPNQQSTQFASVEEGRFPRSSRGSLQEYVSSSPHMSNHHENVQRIEEYGHPHDFFPSSNGQSLVKNFENFSFRDQSLPQVQGPYDERSDHDLRQKAKYQFRDQVVAGDHDQFDSFTSNNAMHNQYASNAYAGIRDANSLMPTLPRETMQHSSRDSEVYTHWDDNYESRPSSRQRMTNFQLQEENYQMYSGQNAYPPQSDYGQRQGQGHSQNIPQSNAWSQNVLTNHPQQSSQHHLPSHFQPNYPSGDVKRAHEGDNGVDRYTSFGFAEEPKYQNTFPIKHGVSHMLNFNGSSHDVRNEQAISATDGAAKNLTLASSSHFVTDEDVWAIFGENEKTNVKTAPPIQQTNQPQDKSSHLNSARTAALDPLPLDLKETAARFGDRVQAAQAAIASLYNSLGLKTANASQSSAIGVQKGDTKALSEHISTTKQTEFGDDNYEDDFDSNLPELADISKGGTQTVTLRESIANRSDLVHIYKSGQVGKEPLNGDLRASLPSASSFVPADLGTSRAESRVENKISTPAHVLSTVDQILPSTAKDESAHSDGLVMHSNQSSESKETTSDQNATVWSTMAAPPLKKFTRDIEDSD